MTFFAAMYQKQILYNNCELSICLTADVAPKSSSAAVTDETIEVS